MIALQEHKEVYFHLLRDQVSLPCNVQLLYTFLHMHEGKCP